MIYSYGAIPPCAKNGRRLPRPSALVALAAVGVVALAASGCGSEGTTSAAVSPDKVVVAGLAAQGKAIAEKHGCVACHSTKDASVLFGPSWKGLYGSQLRFTDGTSAVADEQYLRNSILDPTAKIIDGWYIAMPSQIPTSEEEISALVAYIKSLK